MCKILIYFLKILAWFYSHLRYLLVGVFSRIIWKSEKSSLFPRILSFFFALLFLAHFFSSNARKNWKCEKKKPMSKWVETIQIFQSKEKRAWVNSVKLQVTCFNTQMSQAALTNKCFSFFSGSWRKSLALLSFYLGLLSPSDWKDEHRTIIHDT